MLVEMSAVVRSSCGAVDPEGAEPGQQIDQLVPGTEHRLERVVSELDVLVVARRGDDVGAAEDGGVLGPGKADHVADDLERERCGEFGDEVALAQGGHPVDQAGGHRLDPVGDGVDPSGTEGRRHDAPQPGVAGIVGRDHAGEELDHVRGEVDDAHGALARAVDLRVAADLEHVGMPGDGAVPASGRWCHRGGGRQVGLGEIGEGALGPKQRERPLSFIYRQCPESDVRQVDIVDPHRRQLGHGPNPS